ncbi:hypothetical protein [Sulfurimonas sp.]|uniref:hypothetical protein n=1 Tax=Sulfurimonas sp. TaxID=2022749 RepID=UPI002633722E|nr:hypothetical protein [Sulfurimonas sp.]MCW8894935.1 hypothetical protein [Sulfurimonas sp.]
MKNFLQVLILLLFSFSFIFANDFREIKKISLKKDEQKKILVKYNDKERLFKFRWTLYKNGGLVVLRSYDTIVAQNILYLRHKNQSFRFDLKTKGTDFYNVPYLLVKFKEFDSNSNEAKFELMLSDKKMQITLEDLKND